MNLNREIKLPNSVKIVAILFFIYAILGAVVAAQWGLFKGFSQTQQQSQIATAPVQTIIPTHSVTPKTLGTSSKVDSDPVEPCTSKNSGDSIMVKRSDCQNKYVDCPIGNTWKVLTKEDCTSAQNAASADAQKAAYEFYLKWKVANSEPGLGYVSVTCPTVYGTYTLSGPTYSEAQKICSDAQAEANSLKAGADRYIEALKEMQNLSNYNPTLPTAQPLPTIYIAPTPTPNLPFGFCNPPNPCR